MRADNDMLMAKAEMRRRHELAAVERLAREARREREAARRAAQGGERRAEGGPFGWLRKLPGAR